MDIKGGFAYIDLKGNSLYNIDAFHCENIFNTIKNAYESGKMAFLCNGASLDSNDILPSFLIAQIRKRDDTHYSFVYFISDKSLANLILRYATVDSNDYVSVTKAGIGNY